MAEDFVGRSGKLEEVFVGALNDKLISEEFVPLEVRAAQEKPQLVAGLAKLKTAMGAEVFDRLVNSLLNVNLGAEAILLLTGDEKVRTELTARWVPAIQQAFGVENVRIVGGGRNGMDAY